MEGDFCGSLVSQTLDFSGFAGKNFANLDFNYKENNFSRISCTVFESNKNGSHLVVFVTLFATNFIEVQHFKKEEQNFCGIFVGGSFFLRDLNIIDQ